MRKDRYGAALPSSNDIPLTVINGNGVVEASSVEGVVIDDNESTPLTQAAAVGAEELQSASSFLVRSVNVNEDRVVGVVEPPLNRTNIPAYLRPRGVVEAPAVWYYSMHRQDDRTIIQIRWLGKTKRWAIGWLVAGLVYAILSAIAWIQGRRGHPSFLLPLLFFACITIYRAARCFFNSTFITLTRDGVEVDERPLKMCGPTQSLGFVDEEGLPVEFVVERIVKTNDGAPKIFYSVDQLDGNGQLMAALRLPLLLGGEHETLHIVQEIGRYLPPRKVEARVVVQEDIVQPKAGLN